MVALTKNIKLMTLFLILRTMPKEQQSLLMAHFSPEVVKMLTEIEQYAGPDIEKLDWTPFYQAWPELQRILASCKEEIKSQKVFHIADEQRPRIREYILQKLGKQKRGAPIVLSQEITKIVDLYLSDVTRKLMS